jgi:hypothetical protein
VINDSSYYKDEHYLIDTSLISYSDFRLIEKVALMHAIDEDLELFFLTVIPLLSGHFLPFVHSKN